jgi:LL-diaminopimelate aminotransferase
MAKQNPRLEALKTGYLFPEINKRKQAFLQECPDASIISLGIGDTTFPISPAAADTLTKAAAALGTPQGYSGYGPEQGQLELRRKIADRIYSNRVDPDEIFISDGAKCDCGRLPLLFSDQTTVAVQNPTYPVYVDTTLISGMSPNIVSMPCTPDNHFFPNPVQSDLIYLCSPNNPTGTAATKEQLETFIAFAKQNQSVILFDAAYSAFIQDNNLPRSIFEIEGSRETAIEINSFSKLAGFTGLRLGWTVVPKELQFDNGASVHQAWSRITSTYFNGASNLAQQAGIAVLEDTGWQENQAIVRRYLDNAQIIKETFQALGYPCYGGDHAPYIWVDYSPKTSWEAFEELLYKTQVLAVPGSGFGSSGEHFVRFSAFASKETILEAMARISHLHAFY